MKKNIPTPLADEYMQSLENLKAVETDDFFYTKLIARMDKRNEALLAFNFKPALMAAILIVTLFINAIVLINNVNANPVNKSQETPIQNFANNYDLLLPTSF